MKFSVVTAVLNGADYLADAIASIRAQTWTDFEHIVVDAGSRDGSVELVEAAAREDDRLRLVVRPGEPLYQSIMWGLSSSSGDVLSWLNADDLYAPWAMATVARFMEADGERQWISGLPGCWDANGVLRYVRPDAWRPQALIRQGWFHKDLLGFIQQESVFFRKSLFESLTDADRRAVTETALAGDFILWKRFARRAKLWAAPTVLGGFRRHDANLSVRKGEAYMAEVRADGAAFLPPVAREIAQIGHRWASALHALKLAAAEDARTKGPPER